MINNVTLVGRIASIYKENPNATYINLAVENKAKKTDFIPLVGFSKTKEFLDKYFYKGKWIGVTGRISVQELGEEGKRINIVINQAEFIGAKTGASEGEKTASEEEFQNITFPIEDESDLPF